MKRGHRVLIYRDGCFWHTVVRYVERRNGRIMHFVSIVVLKQHNDAGLGGVFYEKIVDEGISWVRGWSRGAALKAFKAACLL